MAVIEIPQVDHRVEEYLATPYTVEGTVPYGWTSPLSMNIIRELVSNQPVKGSVMEIGVHQGMLFILLALLTNKDTEKAIAIDVFEDQHLNRDKSGLGERDVFERYLNIWVQDKSLQIIKSDSTAWDLKKLLEKEYGGEFVFEGKIRFASVDGGHTRDVVESDLFLIEGLLCDGGIVALDDIYRTDWGGVTAGLYEYFKEGNMIPFLMASNKIYLTTSDRYAKLYQNVIKSKFVHQPLEFWNGDIIFVKDPE